MEEEKKEEPIVEETKKENILTRKKEVKGKPLKVWLIVMIAIFMLITFGLGVYFGKEVFNKKDKEKNNEPVLNEEKSNESIPVEEKKEIIEELNINSDFVNYIMNRFSKIAIYDEHLYQNDKYEIESITDPESIMTAIKAYNPPACSNNYYEVTLKDLNEKLNNVVANKNISFDMLKKEQNNIGSYDSLFGADSIEIIDENHIRLRNSFCGAIASGDDFINSKIVKAEKTNDAIYVYVKKVFARYDSFTMSSDDKVSYYLDYKRSSNKMETVNVSYGVKEEPNWDLYNTYKYTFKLINGDYYFESFELVK